MTIAVRDTTMAVTSTEDVEMTATAVHKEGVFIGQMAMG
jgi:hypothetical protein